MPLGSVTPADARWRLRATAAVVAFVLVATDALAALLAVPAGRVLPAAALAALPALAATALLAPRVAVLTTGFAAPASAVAVGVPVAALSPGRWRDLLAEVGGSAHAIAAGGRVTAQPAALAGALLLSAALWTVGAVLGASSIARRGRGHGSGSQARLAVGLALLTAPWLTAIIMRGSDHSAWQGAAVLVAGVLWFCGGRTALSLAVAVAIPSAALAGAVGPIVRWFGHAHRTVSPSFHSLQTEPTYGPLADRRTGATMLIVTAPAPALWRMQTLDYSDGRWIVPMNPLPRLPEPAARREDLRVRVAGLHQDLAVAPGRIERITALGKSAPTSGEAMLLAPAPTAGATYRVQAAFVHPAPDQLSQDRAQLDAAARAYTRLGPEPVSSARSHALASLLAPFLALVPDVRQRPIDPRVVSLGRRLAHGASTEWEIVTRVERYLVDSGRFRYTTKVPPPGPQPLVEFLLRTHAGYCQQFAGAAALLLRVAGVPARVVSGFATGRQVGPDRYVIRDSDAHEWIEVYFERYGWVPFNPTPAADPALIAAGIDPIVPSRHSTTTSVAPDVRLVLILVAAVGLMVRRRRRRSRRDPAALWRVARRAGGEIEPSTTLAAIRVLLAERVGPRTAAIASALELERFAPGPTVSHRRPRMVVVRALVGDLGPLGSLLFWMGPQRCPRHMGKTRTTSDVAKDAATG